MACRASPGIELAVTPLAGRDAFVSGKLTARVIVQLDVAILRPAAFARATSIT